MQGNVDMAHFYLGTGLGCCSWGLFDFLQSSTGVMTAEPRRSYFSFKAFYQLSEAKNKLKSSASRDVYALAGINDAADKVNVLLSTYATTVDAFDLRVGNLPWEGETVCTVYLLDEKNKLKQISKSTRQTSEKAILINDVLITAPSVCLITVQKK